MISPEFVWIGAAKRENCRRGREPTEGIDFGTKPRRGDRRMSPLRGLELLRHAYRGLTPTAKLYRHCAAEEIRDEAARMTDNKNSHFPRKERAGVICPRSRIENGAGYFKTFASRRTSR